MFFNIGISNLVGYINQLNNATDISASKGPLATLGYNYFFNKRWGIGLVGTLAYYKAQPLYFSSHASNPLGGYWRSNKILIEGIYSPIVKDKWQIEIVQGIGVVFVSQPEYDLYVNYTGTVLHKPKDKDWNTNYNIGLKGKVLVKENFGVQLNVNYSYDFTVRTKGASFFNTIDTQLGVFYNLK